MWYPVPGSEFTTSWSSFFSRNHLTSGSSFWLGESGKLGSVETANQVLSRPSILLIKLNFRYEWPILMQLVGSNEAVEANMKRIV